MLLRAIIFLFCFFSSAQAAPLFPQSSPDLPTPESRAESRAGLPSDFTYEPTLQKNLPAARALAAIDVAFRQESLIPFRPGLTNEVSPSWLDQVYVDDDLGRAVFVKLGLNPVDQAAFGRLYDQGDGQLIHLRADRHWSVAVFFHGFTPGEIERMVARLKGRLAKPAALPDRGRPTRFASLLIPEARARICSPSNSDALSLQALSGISGAVDKRAGAVVESSCLSEVWQGLKDSSLRKMANMGDTVSDLIHRPIEAWHSVVSTFKNLTHFFADFRGQIGQAVRAIKEISGELNSELVCAFVGEMSPDIVLLVAGGYGSAKLAVAMAEYARRLASIQKFLALAGRLASVASDKAGLRIFLKQFIRGEVSPERAAAMERFSEAGSKELAMGAARCVP